MDSLHELQQNRGWLIAFGIIAIVAGLAAITYSVLATLVSVIFLAWLLIFAGVLEVVYAIRHRERGHLILYLLEGILAIVVGALLLQSPARGAVVLTLLLAAYFVLAGIFRIVGALALRLPHWGWVLASGIISLALGIVVWGGWPTTGLWVIGLFIGINMIFSGFARLMLGLALRPHRLSPLPI
jgi:uncharacterized membrane protein HdeD (DUF308 family)